MEKHKVDIAAFQETHAEEGKHHFQGQGMMHLVDKGNHRVPQKRYGLGFYISARMEEAFQGINRVSDRISVAKFTLQKGGNTRGRKKEQDLYLINVYIYAPTNTITLSYREPEERSTGDMVFPNFWNPNCSRDDAELEMFNNEVIRLFPPDYIYARNISYDTLFRRPFHTLSLLNRELINADQYPENVRKSAVIEIAVKDFLYGARLSYHLKLSAEQIRYYLESSPFPLPTPLDELYTKMANERKWCYLPTFRRFSGETFGLPVQSRDPQLVVVLGRDKHSSEPGFIVHEFGDVRSQRVLDFSYSDNYLYFFKKHSQWNQVLLPEYVHTSDIGLKPIYRMKMTFTDSMTKFQHLSATKALYLQVVDLEGFIAGKSRKIRMTSDLNLAAYFVIKAKEAQDRPISMEQVVERREYVLYLCTPAGIEYPIYLSKCECFEEEAKLVDALSFPAFLNEFKGRPTNHIAAAPPVQIENEGEDEEDDEDKDPDEGKETVVDVVDHYHESDGVNLQQQNDLLRTVAESITTIAFTSHISDAEVARVLSPDFLADHILFHPCSPVIGIRGLTMVDAFPCAIRLYSYLKPFVSSDTRNKSKFTITLRHGRFAENQVAYSYGIGCTTDGTPTFLNKYLMLLNTAEFNEWSRVTMQIHLDFKSYLMLLPSFERRYEWLKRALRESIPTDALECHRDHQVFMSSELLTTIQNHVDNSREAQSNRVITVLRSIEEAVLSSRNVKTFPDLHIQQKSFLEFASAHEPTLSNLLNFDIADPRREGFYRRVEEVGIRYLLDHSLAEEGHDDEEDANLATEDSFVHNVLGYFGVGHASELGYASNHELFQAVLRRHRTSDRQTTSPLLRHRPDTNDISLTPGEDAALKALIECPVLGNLYDHSRWKLLYERSQGPILTFLRSHRNRIPFLEIGHNLYLRLPDINQVSLGSEKEAYLSVLLSVNPSINTEITIRQFVGGIVALWALRVSGRDLKTATAMLVQGILESRSALELFQLSEKCIELLPQELVIEVGELVVEILLSEPVVRQLEASCPNGPATVSASTRMVLLCIAQNLDNPRLLALLQHDTQTATSGLANHIARPAVTADTQLADPWSSNSVNEVHETLEEVPAVDRSEELVKICEELAFTRQLTLSSDHNRYIAKPGSEGLQSLNKKVVTILAQQLYTHQGRSIFELIQNADDCDYLTRRKPQLSIDLTTDYILTLAYNESGFKRENILAISDVSGSTKTHSLSQGGKKGIGFKSVFMISEEPEVHSKGFHFKFNEQGEMGHLSPIPIKPDDVPLDINQISDRGTVLVLPLRRTVVAVPGSFDQMTANGPVAPEYVQAKMFRQIQEQLGEVDSEVLLFLRRLRQVKVNLGDVDEGGSSVKFEREDVDFLRFIRVSSSDSDFAITRYVMGEETSLAETLVLPQNPVEVAIPLQETAICNVSALLPIRSHGLPFHLNGPFQLTANREDIVRPCDSELNRRLILKVPAVYNESMKKMLIYAEHQSESKQHIYSCCSAMIRTIPSLKSVSAEFKEVSTTIVNQMQHFPCIPAIIFKPTEVTSDRLYHVGEVSLVTPAQAVILSSEWRDLFDNLDLAKALSAPGQVTKYLVDPDFVLSPSVAKALDIKTIDVEMLKNAIIHLWNDAVSVSHKRHQQLQAQSISSVDLNGPVFVRLLSGLFKLLPSSKHTLLFEELNSKLLIVELPERKLVTLEKTNASYIPRSYLKLMTTTSTTSTGQFIQLVAKSSIPILSNDSNRRGAASALTVTVLDPSMTFFLEDNFLSKQKMPISPNGRLVSDLLLDQWIGDGIQADINTSTRQAQIQLIAFVWNWLQSVLAANNDSSVSSGSDLQAVSDRDETDLKADDLIADMMSKVMTKKEFVRVIKEAIEAYFPQSIARLTVGSDSAAAVAADGATRRQHDDDQAISELYEVVSTRLAMILAEEDDDQDDQVTEATAEEPFDSEIVTRLNNKALSNYNSQSYQARIGQLGERLMFQKLREQYPEHEGYNVIWENLGQEQGYPYDISIRKDLELHARVEVKTTRLSRTQAQSQVFEISINESAMISKERDHYWIARVYNMNLSMKSYQEIDFDLITNPFYQLHEHQWKLVCKMASTTEEEGNGDGAGEAGDEGDQGHYHHQDDDHN